MLRPRGRKQDSSEAPAEPVQRQPDAENARSTGSGRAVDGSIFGIDRATPWGNPTYWLIVTAVGAILMLMAQNWLLWWKISQQQAAFDRGRRMELLTVLFEPTDCDPRIEREQLQRQLAEATARVDGIEAGSEAYDRALHDRRVLASRDPQICPPKAPLRLREEALLTLAEIDGPNLSLKRSNLRHMSLPGAELSEVHLPRADLSGANFANAVLRRAFLRHARGIGTYLRGADLQLADLENADLEGAFLTEADLTGADLRGTRLVGTNLIRTLFLRTLVDRADFTDADLGGADLTGALGLTQEQLDSAYGTSKTKIPPDLVRPAHWRKAVEPDSAEPRTGPAFESGKGNSRTFDRMPGRFEVPGMARPSDLASARFEEAV